MPDTLEKKDEFVNIDEIKLDEFFTGDDVENDDLVPLKPVDETDPKDEGDGDDDVPPAEKDPLGEKDESEGDGEEDGEEKPEEEPVALIEEVTEMLGYEIEETFEDTPEGLVGLVKAASSQMAEDSLARIFDEYPDVKEFFDFRINGGDSRQFFQTVHAETDWSEISLEDASSDTQERVVRASLSHQGMGAEDIDEMVDAYRTANMLEIQSKKSLKILAAQQKAGKLELVATQKAEAQAARDADTAYWGRINTLIEKSSTFHGIPLAEKDKSTFLDFISAPTESGHSAYQDRLSKMTDEEVLAVQLLVFRGFDLDSIVDRKASSKHAKSLRNRLNASNERLQGTELEKEERGKTVSPSKLELEI